MFLGHHAVAFASKRVAPCTSLDGLVSAAVFLDLLWPTLVLTGVEKVRSEPDNTAFTPLAFDSHPLSRSLVMSLALAVAAALAYWEVTR